MFRSYLLLYQHYAVFLPRYNDHDLYRKLPVQPDTAATWSGKEHPWPSRGPTFFHDFYQAPEE